MLSKKIHYPVTLEVHQDSAGMRCAQTKVVYTQHTHDVLGIGTKSLSDAVQEGVRADEQSHLASQPRSRLAAQSESDPLQSLPLAVGGAGVDAGYLIQALGEDPTLAGGLVAEELPHSNPEAYRHPAPRQVGQSAGVAPVDPTRRLPAERALGREIGRGGVDGQ
jgi:hypothetical protein